MGERLFTAASFEGGLELVGNRVISPNTISFEIVLSARGELLRIAKPDPRLRDKQTEGRGFLRRGRKS